MIGGQPFSRGALFHLLRNRVYLGMIVHKGVAHAGEHEAIVDQNTFDAVQRLLDANARRRGTSARVCARAPLTGKVFDTHGKPMSPTFSYGRHGKLYRYYVSSSLQTGQHCEGQGESSQRTSASNLEQSLTKALNRLFGKSITDPLQAVQRVEIHSEEIELLLPIEHLSRVRRALEVEEHAEPDPANPKMLRLTLPACIAGKGGGSWIVGQSSKQASKPDPVLVKALRTAHSMIQLDRTGLPTLDVAPSSPHHRRLLRLAFLAPDLQQQILQGSQPPELTLSKLLQSDIPSSWATQRKMFGPHHVK